MTLDRSGCRLSAGGWFAPIDDAGIKSTTTISQRILEPFLAMHEEFQQDETLWHIAQPSKNLLPIHFYVLLYNEYIFYCKQRYD